MRKMSDMPYVIGCKVRIFPSRKQQRIIQKNIGAQRFVYNRMVALNREIHSLEKVQCYSKPVSDRLSFLRKELSSVSELQNLCPFLYDDDVDAQAVANGIKNYRTAWNNFRKVRGTSIPTFHRKSYAGSYQTNPHYRKDATRIGISGR